MFTVSKTFTRLSLVAAAAIISLAIAAPANAQTIRGNTVVGGFAKNGGAVRAVDLNANLADDVANARQKAARTAQRLNTRAAANTTGARLPSNLKSGIENLSGKSLNNVRIHYNSNSLAKVSPNAFTKGTRIHPGPGQAKHLPHEAWHVTNQKTGRVRARASIHGNPNLAKEADVLGKRANSVKSAKSAKSASFAKKAKSAQTVAKGAKTAKVARHAKAANNVRKGLKAANTARKAGRLATASTGVGVAVVAVDVAASMAGVNPADMAILKATDPAAYNRKMAALKKNPMKYMGNNLKNNTAKGLTNVGNATIKTGQAIGKASKNVSNATKMAAQNVGKATKTAANKMGCGVGNIFKKKKDKKKC